MAAFGSGLSAQLGYKAETTPGTEVTVDKFIEMLSEDLKYDPTWLEGQGLRAGTATQRASRTQISRHSASGSFTVEHADKGGMGLLWKHALGSLFTTPTVIATTAFKQNHHFSSTSTKDPLGLTVQVGKPQTDAVVRPHTYYGAKITGWEFSCSDNQYAQLKLNFDAWNENVVTSLAVASYPVGAGVFTFADAATFKIGGTPTTAGSPPETTIAGGVALTTLCKGITITGSFPLATERYGLGNAGVKKNQAQNGIPEVTATLDAEYTQRTELYDLLKSATATALELVFAHGDAGSGNPYSLSFVMPAVKIREGGPTVGGPDLTAQQIGLKALEHDAGTHPVLQVRLVSTDTVL